MRVVLCLFGVIPRSIKWTWPVFVRQLIQPLQRRGHTVDVFGWNLELNAAFKVDEMLLNQSDVSIVPFKALDNALQTDVDAEIARLCPHGVTACRSFDDQARDWPEYYRNAFRQLHSEMRVARFLATATATAYDVAIAAVPDLHLAMEIDIAELSYAAAQPSIAFTTLVNDAGGYTNGFYIGRPSTLATLMARFYDHRELLKVDLGPVQGRWPTNYETLLRKAFARHGVRRVAPSAPSIPIDVRTHGAALALARAPSPSLAGVLPRACSSSRSARTVRRAGRAPPPPRLRS